MFAPVALFHFLGNQQILGLGIGNTQKRFGQAHQGDPFLIGEAKLVHKDVQRAALFFHRPGGFNNLSGNACHLCLGAGI